MYIRKIRLYHIEIPFHFSIDHNLKKRQRSSSIVVELETNTGITGFGEGAPRSYVTGEQLDRIQAQSFHLNNFLVHRRIQNTMDIKRMSSQIRLATNSPALQCAVEVALLDILGKARGKATNYFLKSTVSQLPNYSGIVPFINDEQLDQVLGVIKKYEIKQVKVKVGDSLDFERLKTVYDQLGEDVDIRLDANRAWDFEEAKTKLSAFAEFPLSGIEEPLKSDQLYLLPKLAHQTGLPVILDETICTVHDAKHWARMFAKGNCHFNLKLSKHGGLFATQQIHRIADRHEITCHLGCNVGVTSIMSAAERLFAQSHELKYLEGSYMPFFMIDDLITNSLSFGKNGLAEKQAGDGLGIRVRPALLKRYGQALYQSEDQHSSYSITQ